MLKALRARIERIEARRAASTFEIVHEHPTGAATLTVVRRGRVIARRELAAGEAACAPGEIVIERSYGRAG